MGIEGEGDIEGNRHRFGTMCKICEHCFALKWVGEPNAFCYINSQVVLAQLEPTPDALYELFTTNNLLTNQPFVEKSRVYNSAFAFTSVRTKYDEKLANANEGVYTYRINGTLHHSIENLFLATTKEPGFAQVYFYDSSLEKQTEQRLKNFHEYNLDPTMLNFIQNELYEINPFVKIFKQAKNEFDNKNLKDLSIVFYNTHRKDMRQYNKSTAKEVATIILDEGYKQKRREILIRSKAGGIWNISEIHGAYDPLQYPLLFPYSEHGWNDKIVRKGEDLLPDNNSDDSDDNNDDDEIMFESLSKNLERTESFASSTEGMAMEIENLLLRSDSDMSIISTASRPDKRKAKEIEKEKEKLKEKEKSKKRKIKDIKGKSKAIEETKETIEVESDNKDKSESDNDNDGDGDDGDNNLETSQS